MSKFDLVKAEVEAVLPKSPLDFELTHGRLVLKWMLGLKPDADEALKIAAISHDIERAITGITEKDLEDYSKINEFKKEHAIRSARFICDILNKYGYSSDIIDRVKYLVENHESGGDEDAEILMSADSLAYFEHNIPATLLRNGRERTVQKIKFMYNRLSDKAKDLVGKMEFSDGEVAELIDEAIKQIH